MGREYCRNFIFKRNFPIHKLRGLDARLRLQHPFM
jgi:hypothetical protein